MATDVNEEEVLELLKCGRCENFMTGEIYECSRGHNVCENCCRLFVKCRICRCWVNMDMRNYALEAMFQFINIPCPFVNCKQTFKSTDLELHISKCEFRNKSLDLMNRRRSTKIANV